MKNHVEKSSQNLKTEDRLDVNKTRLWFAHWFIARSKLYPADRNRSCSCLSSPWTPTALSVPNCSISPDMAKPEAKLALARAAHKQVVGVELACGLPGCWYWVRGDNT